MIVLRVLEGLGEGTTFPALSALLAMWIPLKERSKLGSLVFGGGQVSGTGVIGTFVDVVGLDWKPLERIIFCIADKGSRINIVALNNDQQLTWGQLSIVAVIRRRPPRNLMKDLWAKVEEFNGIIGSL